MSLLAIVIIWSHQSTQTALYHAVWYINDDCQLHLPSGSLKVISASFPLMWMPFSSISPPPSYSSSNAKDNISSFHPGNIPTTLTTGLMRVNDALRLSVRRGVEWLFWGVARTGDPAPTGTLSGLLLSVTEPSVWLSSTVAKERPWAAADKTLISSVLIVEVGLFFLGRGTGTGVTDCVTRCGRTCGGGCMAGGPVEAEGNEMACCSCNGEGTCSTVTRNFTPAMVWFPLVSFSAPAQKMCTNSETEGHKQCKNRKLTYVHHLVDCWVNSDAFHTLYIHTFTSPPYYLYQSVLYHSMAHP